MNKQKDTGFAYYCKTGVFCLVKKFNGTNKSFCHTDGKAWFI